jgi:hypothetical protein
LLSFGAESFVFQRAIQKVKNEYIYKIIFFPAVWNGCKTWSPTQREESRLRVFENRMLRRIFGPKRDEVTGDWRKLHNTALNDLYSSPNTTRVIKSREVSWAGHVACMGERRVAYRVMVRKPEGKIQLGRPRRR